MTINPIVAEHLQEARRVLIEQRESLDHDIAQLDAMLGRPSLGSSDTSATPTTPRAASSTVRGPAPAMKDAIRDFLLSEDRDFSTNEVAVALREQYGWELSSTRSQIAKMGKTGEVVAVRRGVYRAATPDPTDTSGPGEAGPEASVTTTGPGGDPHAQADRDQGDYSINGTLHRDDRGGAAIAASPS